MRLRYGPGLLAMACAVACTPHHTPVASPAALSPLGVVLPACQTAPVAVTDIPDGPATGAIAGEAVTTAFAFDSTLTIAPPPRGYQPAVTQAQARCELESAVSSGPVDPGVVALATVTLTGPSPAGVPPYQGRVAWVMIDDSSDVAPSCPAESPEPSAPASPDWPTPRGGPEQVTAVDARTGGSAMYVDEHYSCVGDPPAPTIGVPLQVQSVPWTFVSRTAGQLTLRSAWPACEAFAANQTVGPPPGFNGMSLTMGQRVSGLIAVRVWRPFGSRCGPDVRHDIEITPDVAGKPLPVTVSHAPLGIESDD